MSNYWFLKSKKNLKFDRMEKFLNKLNNDRFDGLLKITPIDQERGFFVSFEDDAGIKWADMDLVIKNHKELRVHGDSILNWDWYVKSLLLHEIGFEFGGEIGSENEEDTWRPEKNKYRNFEDFSDQKCPHISKEQRLTNILFEVPKGMEKF